MAYAAVYDSGEISEVTVDLIITIVAALVGFGTLIAIVLLYVWLKGKSVHV